MARQQVVSYTVTCDVCGEDIPESDAENASRLFSWERSEYVVDVCSIHQAELSEILDLLKSYVDAGSASADRRSRAIRTAEPKSGRRRPSEAKPAGATGPRRDVAAIRAWAVQNGLTVGDRGRVPAKVIEAYDSAAEAPAAVAPAKPARARRSRKASAAPAEEAS